MNSNFVASIVLRSAKYALYPFAIHVLMPALVWGVFNYSDVMDIFTKWYWWGLVSGPIGSQFGEPLFYRPYIDISWVPANVWAYLLVGICWYAIFFIVISLLLSLAALNAAILKWREKS
jgi:hypothetical protein